MTTAKTTYRVTSCKGSETIEGDALAAIRRAIVRGMDLLPAGGTDVRDADGVTVATVHVGADAQQRGGLVVEMADGTEVDVSGMEEREARKAIRAALAEAADATPAYVECREQDIPTRVRWDVPQRNQGQIVEVAYGDVGLRGEADEGAPYMRVTDRSDRSVAYHRLARS